MSQSPYQSFLGEVTSADRVPTEAPARPAALVMNKRVILLMIVSILVGILATLLVQRYLENKG